MSRKIWFFIGLCFICSVPVYAEKKDREQKIDSQSKEVTFDQKNNLVILEGNVVITQGTIKMTAAKVVVIRDAEGQQSFDAQGQPVRFEQKLEGKKEWIKGQGARVLYTSHDHQVILSGKAKVERGGDVVTGETITYNTVSEVYKAQGSKASPRVHIVLQPKSS